MEASAPVAELERSLIAFRCDVFECGREDARRLRQAVLDQYGGGAGTNALPADYLEAGEDLRFRLDSRPPR